MGTEVFGVDIDVDVEVPAFVDEVLGADVDEEAVVVVDVEAEADAITKPQPRAGSFRVRGFEMGNCAGGGEEGGVVVVVGVVGVLEFPLDVVRVVGPVVDVVLAAFLELFKRAPTSTNASSTTARTIRSGQRRWEGVLNVLRISSSR
jgi:hypothetical protein